MTPSEASSLSLSFATASFQSTSSGFHPPRNSASSLSLFYSKEFSAGIFAQVEAAQEKKADVEIGNQSYNWLHDVFNRTLPLHPDPVRAKEIQQRGDVPITFSWYLWRENSWLVQNALRDPGADKAYESDLAKIGKED